MPDVFVPWDSTMFSDYYVELRRKGVLNTFSLQYVEQNRPELNEQFPSIGSFNLKFNLEPEIIKDFQDLAEKEGVKFDNEGWQSSELLIITQIKAMIARNLWDVNAFYEIMTPIDEEFLKAVDLLFLDFLFLPLLASCDKVGIVLN